MDKQKSVGRPKKPATKKPATKKPATKKVTTKKPATKKVTTKKPATKKVTTKKPATKKVTTKKPATKKASSKSKKGFLGFVKEMFSMNGGGDGHCPEGMVENLDTGAMEPFEMNGGGNNKDLLLNRLNNVVKNGYNSVFLNNGEIKTRVFDKKTGQFYIVTFDKNHNKIVNAKVTLPPKEQKPFIREPNKLRRAPPMKKYEPHGIETSTGNQMKKLRKNVNKLGNFDSFLPPRINNKN